jgi:hypothetical protein
MMISDKEIEQLREQVKYFDLVKLKTYEETLKKNEQALKANYGYNADSTQNKPEENPPENILINNLSLAARVSNIEDNIEMLTGVLKSEINHISVLLDLLQKDLHKVQKDIFG